MYEALHKCLEGASLANAGKMQEALEAFDGAIENDPSLAASWYNRGFVLCAEEHYAEALEAFDKAIEIAPRMPNPWNGKGYVLCTLKRYREALEAFSTGLEINPTMAYSWTGIGDANTGLERYQEALEAFNRAIEIEPRFALPWSRKANLLEFKPELEVMAGHTARQSLCRAVYLRQSFRQRFPLPAGRLVEPVRRLNLYLLAHKLFEGMDAAKMSEDQRQFLAQIRKDSEEPLAVLSFLDSSAGLGGVEKSFWKGIINYYYGDPVCALEHFNEVDSEDEACLAGQYYLLLSLNTVMEPSEKEQAFALKQAGSICGEVNPADKTRQFYYAGQIHGITGNWRKAEECFAANDNHLPSLYMRYMSLRMQDSRETGMALSDILENELEQVRRGNSGYLAVKVLPEINPAASDWMQSMEFSLNFLEINPVLQCIRENENVEDSAVYRESAESQNNNGKRAGRGQEV